MLGWLASLRIALIIMSVRSTAPSNATYAYCLLFSLITKTFQGSTVTWFYLFGGVFCHKSAVADMKCCSGVILYEPSTAKRTNISSHAD